MNQQAQIVAVADLRGIVAGDRVSVQDVEASPPQVHQGNVKMLWSDSTATINWDDSRLHIKRDRHLVVNGHVDIHYVSKLNV